MTRPVDKIPTDMAKIDQFYGGEVDLTFPYKDIAPVRCGLIGALRYTLTDDDRKRIELALTVHTNLTIEKNKADLAQRRRLVELANMYHENFLTQADERAYQEELGLMMDGRKYIQRLWADATQAMWKCNAENDEILKELAAITCEIADDYCVTTE